MNNHHKLKNHFELKETLDLTKNAEKMNMFISVTEENYILLQKYFIFAYALGCFMYNNHIFLLTTLQICNNLVEIEYDTDINSDQV